jgi:hypothetical protein
VIRVAYEKGEIRHEEIMLGEPKKNSLSRKHKC